MSFQTLSERLATLQESNNQLKELIDRLAGLKFQPGSIPLDNEEGNVMTELTSEIQQTLREQEDDFELLQEDVYELDGGKAGSELDQQKQGLDYSVKRCVKELKTHQAAFRKAQLSARRNLQAAQRQERELLLKSYLEPRSSTSSPTPLAPRRPIQTKELTKEEKALNASSDVTLALRRTHNLMASELSRSQFAHDTLKESNAALEALNETYSTLDTMLSSSKNLLGTLLRSQKSDTWYLETAFYILLATIAWLVWRRILYGPTWWLVWFPLKMFIKGWVGVLTTLGVFGATNADGVEVSSSVAASSISLVATVSSVVHAQGTRGPRAEGGRPPSVKVGGGGRGAPMTGPNIPGVRQSEGGSVSEEVGRIIDESKKDSTINEEAKEEDRKENDVDEEEIPQPNPKKRMWEEEREAPKQAQKEKDEL